MSYVRARSVANQGHDEGEEDPHVGGCLHKGDLGDLGVAEVGGVGGGRVGHISEATPSTGTLRGGGKDWSAPQLEGMGNAVHHIIEGHTF